MHARILLPSILLSYCLFAAGDAVLDRNTLRGLSSVNVIIDRLDPQLEGEGLRADRLQDEIEGRLQNAGIKVNREAKEFLGLRILPVRAGKGQYGLCVALGLYQPVLLARDNKVRTATQTWEVESVLLSDRKQLFASTMGTVDELTNRFAEAWKSVQ
jgi:hypothetical protein